MLTIKKEYIIKLIKPENAGNLITKLRNKRYILIFWKAIINIYSRIHDVYSKIYLKCIFWNIFTVYIRNILHKYPSHPWSWDSQGQRTFLASLLLTKPATMTQSAQTTITPNQQKALGLSRSKIKWWAIYIYIESYIELMKTYYELKHLSHFDNVFIT